MNTDLLWKDIQTLQGTGLLWEGRQLLVYTGLLWEMIQISVCRGPASRVEIDNEVGYWYTHTCYEKGGRYMYWCVQACKGDRYWCIKACVEVESDTGVYRPARWRETDIGVYLLAKFK